MYCVQPVAVTRTSTGIKIRKRALGNRAFLKKQEAKKKRVVVDLACTVPTKNNELQFDPYFPAPTLKKPPKYDGKENENVVDLMNVAEAMPNISV